MGVKGYKKTASDKLKFIKSPFVYYPAIYQHADYTIPPNPT
jgi:hypothetical protein